MKNRGGRTHSTINHKNGSNSGGGRGGSGEKDLVTNTLGKGTVNGEKERERI